MSKTVHKRLIDSDGELNESVASAIPSSAHQDDLRYCIHCGSANRPEGRYCRKCGQSLDDQEVAPEDQFPLRGGNTSLKRKHEKQEGDTSKGEKTARHPLQPHEAAMEVIITLVILTAVILIAASPSPWLAIGVLIAWLMATAARYGALN